MLNPEDRQAIDGLFQRLRDVEVRGGERDPDAEALIRRYLAAAPAAPYYLAQTVLVQEHALKVAEQRIADLEQQVRERPAGGLFGGLFGDNRQVPMQREAQGQREDQVARRGGPWDRDDGSDRGQPGFGYGGGRGGGFLAGAAQTAMGVAGGVLLGNAIGSLFGAGSAHAAEAPADTGQDSAQDAGQDAGNDAGDPGAEYGDAGGDVGGDMGGGDFDFGGDF